MFASRAITRLSTNAAYRSKPIQRRLLTTKEPVKEATANATKETSQVVSKKETVTWWNSAELWGRFGAIAGWGMSGAAIYDAMSSSPEIISLNMTTVLIVYSSLFARWAFIVKPQNLLLAGCHVTNVGAQLNQMRLALAYKTEHGGEKGKKEVETFLYTAGAGAMGGLGCLVGGPVVRKRLMAANLGLLTTVAVAEAGPFTTHFWAPMSKWLISGASFMDLHRDTDKISIAQYTALTFTGLFFSRYSLLVQPVNYALCSVNIALFGSSGWHLGRKINADYIEKKD